MPRRNNMCAYLEGPSRLHGPYCSAMPVHCTVSKKICDSVGVQGLQLRPRRSTIRSLRDFLVVDHESEGHPTPRALLNRKVIALRASGSSEITKYVANGAAGISSPRRDLSRSRQR